MTLKHILAMDTISTLKDKKSYESFQNLLDEVIISAEKNGVLFFAWIGKKTKINTMVFYPILTNFWIILILKSSEDLAFIRWLK